MNFIIYDNFNHDNNYVIDNKNNQERYKQLTILPNSENLKNSLKNVNKIYKENWIM